MFFFIFLFTWYWNVSLWFNIKPRCHWVGACSISELLKYKERWVPGIIFFWKISFFVCLGGSILNKIFQFKSQSCIFQLLTLEAETMALFRTEKREVSSTNNLTLVVRPEGRPLI